MAESRQMDQAFPDGQSNQNKSNLPTRKPKLPAVLTKENIEKARIAVRNSGKIGACDDILKNDPSTILKWRKKFPEFGQAISQALEEHKILRKKEHPELFIQAIANLKILLQDRPMKEEKEVREESIDAKSGEVVTIKRINTTRSYVREPTWHAIESILGKRQLKKIIYRSVKESTGTEKLNIVKQMFGEWIRSDELGSQWNGSIFNDMLDIMLIRTLQAETRRLYEDGNLDFKEYNKITLDQTKYLSTINNNRERRAIKLLQGHSYFEIMDSLQDYIQTVIDMVHEVANDFKINRKEIAYEVAERLRKLPDIKGFSAWSNYKYSPTSEKKT